MYRHLLVPLDGSELTQGLTTQALAYAADTGARVSFLHVLGDYGATSEGALERTLSPEHFAAHQAGPAERILAAAHQAAEAAGVACETLCQVSDHPNEAILDTAREQGCDLIFMASHGRRGLDRLVLGSQTARVLEASTLPVLVARV